jgi:hypothetical protein
VARRPLFRAARLAALATLTVSCALALAPAGAAVAAPVAPSPSPSSSPSSPTSAATPALATFGLTSASGGRPDDRSFLAVTAPPGSVIYDSVAVVNQSDTPLDLALYSADAQNSADGTIGLPDRTVKPTDAGAWITFGTSTVTVAPQSTKGIGYTVVPITVTIPTDAEPGDHVAGVVTSLTSQGTATGKDQSATVNLEQRVGLRVYVTVGGPVTPGLVITNVKAAYHPAKLLGLAGAGSASLTYTLTNTGNTRLSVLPTSAASGPFGLGKVSATGKKIDELLPKASVTQTVELSAVWPLVADTVRVTAAATAPVAGNAPSLAAPTAHTVMWAVPWAYLALLALIAAGWWWLRHRRQRRAASRRGRRVRTRQAGADTPTPSEAAHPQTQTVS